MRHWLETVAFVTSVAAVMGLLWVLLAVPRYIHRVLVMMWSSGYGWKDSRVLIRRKTRQEVGPPPGRHRTGTEPMAPAMVAIEPPKAAFRPRVSQEPGSEVVITDLLQAQPETPWPPPQPPGPHDPAHTMTMTQPVTLPVWKGPGPPPPWYPRPEGDEHG